MTASTDLQPSDDWDKARALQGIVCHEPHIAVDRFWLSYAPKKVLQQKHGLIPDWHTHGNAALSPWRPI